MPDYSRALALHSALTKLGVPSMTAVGVVGSLAGESGLGLNPKSRNPGDGADGSDSLNFGQWNGPRARALIQAAQQNGLAPDSFDAGMLHMKNELTGPYSKVLNALKAKDDPNYGADVWTRQYEVPGNVDAEVRRRQGLAQQFAGILGSKGAPVTSSTEAPAAPQDDVAASQAVLKSVPSDIQASAAEPASESTWDRVQKEGLAGLVSKDWNLGDALMGSGVAMMAHSNPNGAAALSALMKNLNDKNKAKEKAALKWLPDANGNRMIGVDSETGQTKAIQSLTPEKETVPQASLKELQSFQSNHEGLEKNADIVNKVDSLRKQIQDLGGDVTWENRGGAIVANYSGNSTENSRMIKDMEAQLNRAVTALAITEKGPMTKAKLEQAAANFVPVGAQYDNVTALQALDRIRKESADRYQGSYNANTTLAKKYKNLTENFTDSDGNNVPDYAEHYRSPLSAWKQTEDEYGANSEKRRSYTQGHDAPKNAANPNDNKKAGSVSPFMQFYQKQK